tara:strand:+ start:4062 stop:5048 length:987 start_codon:yes stop_codon:yes gene_type:complete
MAKPTTSEVWDSRWSSTRRAIQPEVIDNFFEDYKALAMHRRSGLKMTDRGGKEISVILESSGGSAESFDRYDSLNKAPVDPFESGFYKRRYYAVPTVLSDTEDWENSGEEQVFDLLESLGNNAMNSLLKAINEDILSAQSGKNMLGYQDHMADATGATVGGINSGTSTFWESQRDTGAVTFTTQTVTNIFNGISTWNNLLDLCQIQGGTIKQFITTYSIVRAYRESLSSQGYARTATDNAKGMGGSLNPSFYTAEVIADNDCPALHTYAVNTQNVKLNCLRQANFRKTPFVSMQANGQLAQLAYTVAGVQLTNNNRRRSGVATAITGS